MIEQLKKFVESAVLPALLEPGEPLLPLNANNYSLEPRSSHVLLQAWEQHKNLSRRIIGLKQEAGRVELTVQHFGGKQGTMQLLDMANPRNMEWRKRGRKLEFRERFGRFLSREFPDWELQELSAEANLEHSLSPAFPRAFLRRGKKGRAAIAAPANLEDPAGILAFGLIWLSYVRARKPKLAIEDLILFLPAGKERQTALRLAFLKQPCLLFIYDEDDHALAIDPRDAGNLDTALMVCHRAPAQPEPLDPELASVPGFERVLQPDGTASLRIYGLEFARDPSSTRAKDTLAHAIELSRLRTESTGLLHTKEPERWLESQVRAHLDQVDPALRASPVYGQVPAFTGGDRGIADLLAIDHSGRLTVLELKASADIQLPLQALDYWMRVAQHAAAGDFTRSGYFPGHAVSPKPPKLLLVAPSLEFHSTAETILSFFSPAIEVQRIGLANHWRSEIRTMFRLSGDDRP